MQKCEPRIPEPDQLPPVAPDQATQRRIFFGISSFHVIATFRRTMFYSYIPLYLRYFLGLDVTHSTLFATLPMIVGATFQTWVWGRLSDRYQRRRTLIVLGEIMAGLECFRISGSDGPVCISVRKNISGKARQMRRLSPPVSEGNPLAANM